MSMVPPASRARSLAVLAVGALAGLGAAVVTIATRADPAAGVPGPAVVAVVDGRPILTRDFLRALSSLAADKRTPVGEPERARVLERLIDEDLLLQAGLEADLVHSSRPVRERITRAVVDAVVADRLAEPVSDDELRAFRDGGGATDTAGLTFEAARVELERAYRRSLRDAELRRYLERLRSVADVIVVEDGP